MHPPANFSKHSYNAGLAKLTLSTSNFTSVGLALNFQKKKKKKQIET